MLNRKAAQQQGHILTVRPHQRHAALNFLGATLGETAQKRLLQVLNAHEGRMFKRALAHARKDGGFVGEPHVLRTVRQPRIGATQLGE